MSDLDPRALGARRQAMISAIAAHADFCADRTGRESLSESVMQAMARVPRHLFVPAEMQPFAYEDTPLPIGWGKTISQPFIVALMTDLLELEEEDRALEIGTGLGYQAAVLAELCDAVFTVELIPELAAEAERRLRAAGYGHVRVRTGDGSRGWREEAPFDKILVAAAPTRIPAALLDQLKPGGRMILPVGDESSQELTLIEKDERGETRERSILPVRFSALTISH